MYHKEVQSLLREIGVTPRKELGQNFLVDPGVIEKIVTFAQLKQGGSVIEIGPGLGVLTKELSESSNLTVIELEEKFCDYLREKFPSVNVVHEDVRMVDFSEFGDKPVVFGNLPYSFSTEILFHLVSFSQSIEKAILLLQKEFAERVAAVPGSRKYGVLSISCQLYADVRLGPLVSGESFYPTARVNSNVLELVFLSAPRYPVDDLFLLKRLVSAAFFRRRKKIVNSIKLSHSFDSKMVEEVFRIEELDPSRRAESLSIKEYVGLANSLCRISK